MANLCGGFRILCWVIPQTTDLRSCHVCQWALRIRRVEGMLPWSERPDAPDAAERLGWATAWAGCVHVEFSCEIES